jgi:hypothetical protein
VTVGGLADSTVTYSLDNTAFSSSVSPSTAGTPWYTRLEISDGDYTGPVTITWQLEKLDDLLSWTPVSTTTTTVTLQGIAENIYASSDGSSGSNYNWADDVDTKGTYHVIATVESDTT